MTSKPVGIKPEVLSDLASRFLINIPDEDKDDPVKLCTHIELAHWFYLDLQRPEDPSLPACSMKEFMATIFQHCPFLVRDSVARDLDKLIAQWKSHKYKRPVRGAIILNHNWTKCLLVQGYPASTSWGFPKGKLEKGENDRDTAVREVYEETGFDIRDLIQESQYLEAQVGDNNARMYIIPGVPEETSFAPKTRKEIRAIQWFKIEDLPRHRKDLTSKQALGKSANAFFMIIPFMSQLHKWIASNQHKLRPTSTTRSTRKPTRGVSAMFPGQGRQGHATAKPTNTPTTAMFPSTVVTSNHEQLIMNTPFQASLSSHAHHIPTANSGDAYVVHPKSQASLGIGPSHVQVTGMREVYPGKETQLIRPPSAPVLPQHLPTTFYQLFPLNSQKEHFLAKGFPVSNSSTVLIPSTHHPLHAHPSPLSSSHVHPSPLSSSHAHPSPPSSSHAHPSPPSSSHVHPSPHPSSHVHPSPLSSSHVHPSPLSSSHVHPSPLSSSHVHPSPLSSSHVHPSPLSSSHVHPSPLSSSHVHPSPLPSSHVHPSPLPSSHVHPSPLSSSHVHPSPLSSSHVHPSPHPPSHAHPSPLSSSHTHRSPLPTNQQPPTLAPLHPQSYTGMTAVYPSHLAHNHYNPVTMATQNVITQSAPVPSHATPSQPSLRPQNVITILSSTQPPSPAIQLKPATAFTEFSFNKKPILACLKR